MESANKTQNTTAPATPPEFDNSKKLKYKITPNHSISMEGSFLRDGSTHSTIHPKVDPATAEIVMQQAVNRIHDWHQNKI